MIFVKRIIFTKLVTYIFKRRNPVYEQQRLVTE